MTVLNFNGFSGIEGDVHPVRDVVGYMVAAYGNHCRMPNRTRNENSEVCCATADVDDDSTHFVFLLGENRIARREGIQNKAVNVDMRALHCLLQIGDTAGGGSYDVRFYLQAETVHPY